MTLIHVVKVFNLFVVEKFYYICGHIGLGGTPLCKLEN